MRPSRRIPTENATVGTLVRHARERRGWSQRELARRAGLARRTVTRIERDDPRHLIQAETWRHVAAALQLPTLRQRVPAVHALRDALIRDMQLPAMPRRTDLQSPPASSPMQAFISEHANLEAPDLGAEVARLVTLARDQGFPPPSTALVTTTVRALRHQAERRVALPDSERVHLAGHGAYEAPDSLPDINVLLGLIDDAIAKLTFVRDAIATYAGVVEEIERLRTRMQKLSAIVFDRENE